MSARLACPPAPGPLEAYVVQFDPLFQTLAQRHGFRTYLSGLLLPRERSKTLTALVGTEPWVAGPGGRGAAAAVFPVRSHLARYWSAFASAPPPAALAVLLDALNAGHGINLYLRI